ncbi:2-succinyl-5-enolpyruvyl-6-hydroxy-3-cyclohexene-1-carboxylic-acid synthase [Candidatus Enterovibrio escicola]|uniref:2-succinyl-5-enolpyruvyl-6-hydroxy-3-cyclohexene-1-carboxylate synthase n=2 Tax=Candidatus Enterovibrio escicola TaxID=1927127 RepID=A0A2A5T290_9GAMM|nr:2-succinyl-5-enolpyruvyl-6-hydroxy-3-cyclohexene-1-carboxylic-acid synthase [Candidatus Enterovibrio escacola]PCS22264.1 2-succinyl-5-enolpyruvyl-6-hydroxy-3- cyclohexene-1-carboxylic-acid synthase [Candidatus Enterovibrio escacola]
MNQFPLNNSKVISQSTMNRIWARLLLMSLQRVGVKDICIAPGSRSTPLTLEAKSLRDENGFPFTLHTHFDERGLGFLALGMAKASDNPVAVIVTSGTAVANLLPAVVESHLTREKLILLTADRPVELIQCGENQAISQRGIFGNHADFCCNLPSPTTSIAPSWLLSTLDENLHYQSQTGGSLHINCPFPEPLYGELEDASVYLSTVTGWLDSTERYLTFFIPLEHVCNIEVDWEELQHKKGLLIAGRLTTADRIAVQALVDVLGWPLLCDPQAGKGSDYAGFDVWMQNRECTSVLAQADVIIQFGSRLVSKRLCEFIQTFNGVYWLVDSHPGRLDPSHRQARRIIAKPEMVANQLVAHTASPDYIHWAKVLQTASHRYFSILQQKKREYALLTELAMAIDFASWLDIGSDLFIGNSLAIRLLDMCCCIPALTVFANRGASGIDGLIATASGVQRVRQRPLVCLLGDISALYDLNSFSLLTRNPYPLVLIVVNNDGGGIFDTLSVPDDSKDMFYRMPHGFDFTHVAAMFGLFYHAPDTLIDARCLCINAQRYAGTTLVEIRVPANESARDLKVLFNYIANASLL